MDDKQFLKESRAWVRQQLEQCADFWLKHGMDQVHGGVYTCLDRRGEVYSTDKSVWMQGRCGWMYAWLCGAYGPREPWLAASRSCLDFLEDHCRNAGAANRLYFTVTAGGRPLRQRRYCSSEVIYAMANGEYYGVTGERERLDRARWAYEVCWGLYHDGAADPTGLGPKTVPETRSGRGFGPIMLLLNVSNVLARTDPERRELYLERAGVCAEEIFRYFVHPELKCLLESVAEDGTPRLDYTEGRAVNPGHDAECVWMLLEHARNTGDRELVGKAAQVFDWAMEAAWDTRYGGMLFTLDCLGKPQESYEHDMKLWWPHAEALISALMLCRDTGEEKYLRWFRTLLDYCRTHFADEECGEWYGYLHRDGTPTEPGVKGTTFKGPFHLPRMLGMVDGMLGELLENRDGSLAVEFTG